MLSAKKRKAQESVLNAKRTKEVSALKEENNMREITVFLEGSHPYGLKPWGNFYSDETHVSIRDTSLGRFGVLKDEHVLAILESCSSYSLLQLAAVSKVFYIFCHHEDLWRAITLKELNGNFDFSNTWKETYCRHKAGPRYVTHRPIKVSGFYSDLLYQPFLCATLGFDPSWLAVDNVDRRSNLSLEDFIEQYERRNRPVVITDVVTRWPAFRKWTNAHLLAAAGDAEFIAGGVPITLPRFLRYCNACREERPLYLFDKRFLEKCAAAALADDYEVPEYLRDDLFAIRACETKRRILTCYRNACSLMV
jgi:hypothetical protein